MSFKEQLKNEILPKTVDYYNSGMGINESIVKAAQDFKLNLDQTDRLMETMNTARVIAHYEKNAEDRTANCDIADKEAIRKMLYGDKPQEKAASSGSGASWGDYSMYMGGETDYRSRSRMEKAASAEQEKPKSEFTIKQAADHVMDYARKVESERRFADERVAMAETHIATNLSKIAHNLSSGYEPERRYALFKAACIKTCPEVVKSVDSEIPKTIIKDAAPHFRAINRANVIDTSSVDAMVDLAKDVEDDIHQLDSMRKHAAACLEHEKEIKGVIRKYAESVKSAASNGNRPGRPGSGGNSGSGGSGSGGGHGGRGGGADPAWLPKPSDVANSLNPFPVGSNSVYNYITGGFLGADAIDEALTPEKPKTDSKLENYIKNVRRSTIVSELYRDDPVLSEADPDAVAKAYATIVQAAPEMSLNKEVVRSVLRQSVNSVAVSPFDAKQWADLDLVMNKNRFFNSDNTEHKEHRKERDKE